MKHNYPSTVASFKRHGISQVYRCVLLPLFEEQHTPSSGRHNTTNLIINPHLFIPKSLGNIRFPNLIQIRDRDFHLQPSQILRNASSLPTTKSPKRQATSRGNFSWLKEGDCRE